MPDSERGLRGRAASSLVTLPEEGDLQPPLRRRLEVLDKARGHRGLSAFLRTLVHCACAP